MSPLPHGSQVSESELCVPSLKVYLRAKHEIFQADQIKTRLSAWEKLSSDPEVP